MLPLWKFIRKESTWSHNIKIIKKYKRKQNQKNIYTYTYSFKKIRLKYFDKICDICIVNICYIFIFINI